MLEALMRKLLPPFAALGALVITAMSAQAFETAQGVTATPITKVPFVISAPGNYYLPGDLECSTPGVAILVNADEVVLDLNGRSLIAKGAEASPNVGIGIAVLNHEDVTIQNGDINGFGAYAILLDASDGKREHNQKNDVRRVNFNNDQIGVLTISGSINEIEFCNFDGDAVGVYDIGTLGGDRFQSDNFENMAPREAMPLGVGIVSSPGKGTLAEDCLFADCVTAGIYDSGAQDKLRFNSFVSCVTNFIGGKSLGALDD